MAFSSLSAPRSGIVRERPYVGQTLAIEVVGLREARRIPPGLQAAYEKLMLRLEDALVANFKAHVPGSPEGRLGRTVHAKRTSRQGIIVGTFGSQFARALDRGFTSVPKRRKALRFSEPDPGQTGFSKRVKVAGRHYFPEIIASSQPIVEAIYLLAFHDPRDLA